jgi:hypothetical protein
VAGDELPAAGEGVEEGVGVRAGLAEAIPAAQLVRPALGRGERGQMALGLDPLATIVAPGVAGDLGGAVEDPDLEFGGHEGEGPPNQGVRDRVVVPVETEVRRLPGDPGAHELAGEGMIRERQQVGAFLVQGVPDAPAGGIAGHGPLMGGLGDPLRELPIEGLDRREAPRREERVTEVLDHPLHAAFLIAAGHGAGLRGEMVVAGELEQPRVEANVRAGPLEDDAFQVVIQQGPRAPAQRGERLDVAAEEALQRLVEGEARVDRAGPGEHEDEARQDAARAPNLHRAEVAPVDLALLGHEGLQPEVRFAPRRGPDGADVPPDLHGGAGVASVAQHSPEARGAQPRILLQRGGDERLVGVQLAGANLRAGVDPAIPVERPAHGRVVHAEGVGDRADRPVLGVKEATHLGALEQRDHRRGSAPRRGARLAHMGQGDVADEAAAPAAAGTARATSGIGLSSLGIIGGLLRTARGVRRRQEDDAGARAGRGSLMRHLLTLGPIPCLPSGVVDPALPTPLIPPAGGVEGRAPCALGAGPGAVPIPAIAHAAEKEHLLTVGTGAAHEPERVHGPLRATRKGVDTREDLCDLWGCGKGWIASPRFGPRARRVEPPGPHPLGALVGIGLPYVGRPGQPASSCLRRLLSRIPPFQEISDMVFCILLRNAAAVGWRGGHSAS